MSQKIQFNRGSGLRDPYEFAGPQLECCQEMKFFNSTGHIRPGMTMFYEKSGKAGYYIYQNKTWWRFPLQFCPWCGKKTPEVDVVE